MGAATAAMGGAKGVAARVAEWMVAAERVAVAETVAEAATAAVGETEAKAAPAEKAYTSRR